jgi:hypothetical protein
MTEEPASALDFDQILKESDPFKLAILGQAAIEELMNAAIGEAFSGNMPAELKRLGFRTRLAMFAALTQLPKKYRNAMMAVAQVRHDFAHGQITALTPERTQVLADAFRPLMDEDRHPDVVKALTDSSRPRVLLVASLGATRAIVEVLATFARDLRERERSALKSQGDLANLLADFRSR